MRSEVRRGAGVLEAEIESVGRAARICRRFAIASALGISAVAGLLVSGGLLRSGTVEAIPTAWFAAAAGLVALPVLTIVAWRWDRRVTKRRRDRQALLHGMGTDANEAWSDLNDAAASGSELPRAVRHAGGERSRRAPEVAMDRRSLDEQCGTRQTR